jgi:beta-glucosidase
VIVPSKTGKFSFSGNTKVKINGQPVNEAGISMEKGKQYTLEATYTIVPFWWNNAIEPSAKLTWVDVSRDYLKEALAAAQKATVIVFCGGISSSLEGEEMPLEINGFSHGDRTSIDLPASQEKLLAELKKTGKPIIYINFSGSAIALNWENENLPAIIQAFYPGEATGKAITRLLFGEINPSGRLPVTFYKSVNDIPDFKNYTMEGRTYRYFRGEALWNFGFGLSYTDFSYKNPDIPETAKAGSDIKITVDVTNTGKMDGEEVVQVYVSDEDASVPVPIRSLAGFKKILLKAGETQKVEILLKAESFSLIDKNYMRSVEPGKFTVSVGGRQAIGVSKDDTSVIVREINITGETVVLK